MIVVSDTSPITALLTIGKADILPKLFGEVFIPPAVAGELAQTHAALPIWLKLHAIQNLTKAMSFTRTLDRGEAEAITLAAELKADHLLIDERRGRRVAQQEGLPVLGLLGVVLLAKRAGLISSARLILEQLDQEAGIYLARDLKETALRAVGE